MLRWRCSNSWGSGLVSYGDGRCRFGTLHCPVANILSACGHVRSCRASCLSQWRPAHSVVRCIVSCWGPARGHVFSCHHRLALLCRFVASHWLVAVRLIAHGHVCSCHYILLCICVCPGLPIARHLAIALEFALGIAIALANALV